MLVRDALLIISLTVQLAPRGGVPDACRMLLIRHDSCDISPPLLGGKCVIQGTSLHEAWHVFWRLGLKRAGSSLQRFATREQENV
ncbi:hypothetical protein GGS24DRAFT_473373 [Hypoxylon argillaceum]|nr:hypothetical protein GGS24DRAFT_473373 [Hypoxylon argillaceum]